MPEPCAGLLLVDVLLVLFTPELLDQRQGLLLALGRQALGRGRERLGHRQPRQVASDEPEQGEDRHDGQRDELRPGRCSEPPRVLAQERREHDDERDRHEQRNARSEPERSPTPAGAEDDREGKGVGQRECAEPRTRELNRPCDRPGEEDEKVGEKRRRKFREGKRAGQRQDQGPDCAPGAPPEPLDGEDDQAEQSGGEKRDAE